MTVSLDDPYLWLEDVTGDSALEWVRAANAETAAELSASGRLPEMTARLRQVLDADDRIPYVRRHGPHLYSFWQDAQHPRGLWRRTTLESYAEEQPEWQVLLDVDALARAEGESWVWQGSQLLRPGYGRALIELSRGGADAAVVREFDLPQWPSSTTASGCPRPRASWAGSTPTPSTPAPTSVPAR